MGFNKLERVIASVLNNAPFIKRNIKYTYQYINFIFNKKNYNYTCTKPIERIGDDERETFFGYYDKSPVNSTGQYIIYQETTSSTKNKPSNNKPVFIVLFDIKNKVEIKRWSTSAYNWQQGAKLMWISEFRFIFNCYLLESDIYASKIIDVNKIESNTVVKFPIYDAKSGFGLSLSYERLNQIMPDYGYKCVNKPMNFDLSKNGIFNIDLSGDKSNLIISIDDIIELHYKPTMNNAVHWFNHIMISPDSENFIFLHRWIKNGKKQDALILSDIKGDTVKCIADDDMVSHCFWIYDNEIISYMRDSDKGDNYYRINIETNERHIIGEGIIDRFGDGHPTVFGNLVVFDTYPNRARMKELYIYNIVSEKLEKIGDFFESLAYNEETRCDLHPKFSIDGKSIFIDSVHDGKRGLYQILLNK